MILISFRFTISILQAPVYCQFCINWHMTVARITAYDATIEIQYILEIMLFSFCERGRDVNDSKSF